MNAPSSKVDRIDYDQGSPRYRELANHIALVADAIAEERITGPYYGVVASLFEQISTLRSWTRDDRT